MADETTNTPNEDAPRANPGNAGSTNAPVAGDGVSVRGMTVRKDARTRSPSCEGRFVPFPGR